MLWNKGPSEKKLKKPVLLSPFSHQIALILIFPYAYNTLHLLAGRFSQGTYLLGTLYFSRFALYNCLNLVSRVKVFHWNVTNSRIPLGNVTTTYSVDNAIDLL